MKITIGHLERGVLFRNKLFRTILPPGEHHYSGFRKETVEVVKAKGRVNIENVDLPTLQKDPEFAKSVVTMNLPDGHIGLIFVDGKCGFAADIPGEYVFWNVLEEHTFQMINMEEEPEIINVKPSYLKSFVSPRLYTTIVCEEGQQVLLYEDNKFKKVLTSGTYYFWNYKHQYTGKIFDLRVTQQELSGQEILTADKVNLRINFVASYRITDPVQTITTYKEYRQDLYSMLQLALREEVGRYNLDQLLAEKESVSQKILQRLQREVQGNGIEVLAAGIRDIILPGEIQNIMNTVLLAEKRAQANVLTRREEVASTRSLLNTAKLMEENSTLYHLKEMEYVERIADKIGTITLQGGQNVLEQLTQLLGSGTFPKDEK